MDDFRDIGFAKLDMSRTDRTGQSETVFAPGKTPEQLAAILETFRKAGTRVLATKCSPEQAAEVAARGIPATYDPVSRLTRADWGEKPILKGTIAVCTGGTADIPVAEEAAGTAEFFGAAVERHYDVGVAGLHRLLSKVESLRRADAVIAVAGMEGALGSVIAGLVRAPVPAWPGWRRCWRCSIPARRGFRWSISTMGSARPSRRAGCSELRKGDRHETDSLSGGGFRHLRRHDRGGAAGSRGQPRSA